MRRLGGVLLAVLTVFVAIGVVYTLRHHDSIPEADSSSLPADPTGSAVTSPGVAGPSSSPLSSPSRSGSGSGSSSAPGTRPLVAFIGDDWTLGVGASSQSKRATTLLSTALKVRELNLGVDGAGYVTRPGYASEVPDAVAAEPQVVVVMGGRNDAVDQADGTDAAARALFTELHQQLPGARIVAVAPMWGDSDAPRHLVALRRSVRAAVTAVGGTYLDVADPIRGHPDLMSDAADPDDGGYRAIAAAIEPELAPLVQ